MAEDMRRQASTHSQNKRYDKAFEIYGSIIEQKLDTISDLKNFLFAFSRMSPPIVSDREKLVYACNKVRDEEFSDGYELFIAEKILGRI